MPTSPFFRSLNWLTVRQGSVASATNTLTFGLATTTRAWNQSFGSGTGFTGFSYLPRRVGSQLLPRMSGLGDVLHGAEHPCLVIGLEVEGTEVDRVVGRPIDAVKRHPDEARALDVLALHIELDRAVGEFDVRQVHGPFAFGSAQTNPLSRAFGETADGPVGGVDAFAVGKRPEVWLNRFLLAGNPDREGKGNRRAKPEMTSSRLFMIVPSSLLVKQAFDLS